MITTQTTRQCADHAGEQYPPRCDACAVLNRPVPPCGYLPGSECRLHPGYPVPCARCARDEDWPAE